MMYASHFIGSSWKETGLRSLLRQFFWFWIRFWKWIWQFPFCTCRTGYLCGIKEICQYVELEDFTEFQDAKLNSCSETHIVDYCYLYLQQNSIVITSYYHIQKSWSLVCGVTNYSHWCQSSTRKSIYCQKCLGIWWVICQWYVFNNIQTPNVASLRFRYQVLALTYNTYRSEPMNNRNVERVQSCCLPFERYW